MTMRIEASTTVDSLIDNLADTVKKAAKDGAALVRKNAMEGNRIAKGFAQEDSPTHGKLYPRSFTYETSTYVGSFGAAFSGIYGPDAGRPQGGMEFEHGSRNSPPHLDLNRSADIIGPKMDRDVRAMVDELYW